VPERIGVAAASAEVVDEAGLAALKGFDPKHQRAIGQRHVAQHAHRCAQPARLGRSQRQVRPGAGPAPLRPPEHVVDGAAQGRRPVQRALRAAQHLQPVEAEAGEVWRAVEAERAGQRHVVDVQPGGGLLRAEQLAAGGGAQASQRGQRPPRLARIGLHTRQVGQQVLQPGPAAPTHCGSVQHRGGGLGNVRREPLTHDTNDRGRLRR